MLRQTKEKYFMFDMKRKKKVIIRVLLFISFFSFIVFDTIRSKNELKNLQFNGGIDSIRANEKGFKSVFLDTDWVYMSIYGNKIDFSIGDSIIKKKDSLYYQFFKRDTLGKFEHPIKIDMNY